MTSEDVHLTSASRVSWSGAAEATALLQALHGEHQVRRRPRARSRPVRGSKVLISPVFTRTRRAIGQNVRLRVGPERVAGWLSGGKDRPRWDRLRSRGRVETGAAPCPVARPSEDWRHRSDNRAAHESPRRGRRLEDILNQLQPAQAPPQSGPQPDEFAGEDDYEVFVSTVLGSTDDTWNAIFTAWGQQYVEPTLVLFRGTTQSACGGASSAVGPHYCPPDETIYIDETFFDELVRRFGATGGDVAEAYVIAHEVGHHVQKRLGIMEEVQRAQQAAGSQAEANALSVRLELQADCYAGVWANSIRDAGVFEAVRSGGPRRGGDGR